MEPQAPAWTRATPWRQGHILGANAAAVLKLVNTVDAAATRVVVISHDCDLVNEDLADEGAAEVIIGREIPPGKESGSLFWARSPRTIHLEYQCEGGTRFIELLATAKTLIAKTDLAQHLPDARFALEPKQRAALQSWLAVRYRRAGFPDEFNNRMRDSKLDERLNKILDRYGKTVTSIYFDVDGGREIDRNDGSPYELGIVLSYDPGADPDASAAIAEEAAGALYDEFEKRLFDKTAQAWSRIHLKACFPISEEELTVSRAKMLQERRVEHLTLRAPEEQPPSFSMRK